MLKQALLLATNVLAAISLRWSGFSNQQPSRSLVLHSIKDPRLSHIKTSLLDHDASNVEPVHS
jgi:hypothetical protein